MEEYRFAGYRIIEFPHASRAALKAIAERLAPHEDEVVERWIGMQFRTWRPPGVSREQLKAIFGDVFHDMMVCMLSGEVEQCINNLEEAGARLSRSNFPFEALILSLHFLEESYMPFLLRPRSEHTQDWLIRMDEFLHVGIAALATSYFEFHREELLAEAQVGRTVQEALSPHPPRRLRDLELGYIYASASERARLGGDFLDVFSFDSDKVAFVVGDLSGHGLDAAAGSATIRSLFRGFMRDGHDLVDTMERLNRVLVDELRDDHFATALAGVYKAPGLLEFVNAGNPLPVVCDGTSRLVEQVGLPLGVAKAASYVPTEVELKPEDVFVSCTDGVIEARVGANLFGESRTVQTIDEMKDASARAIAEHLQDRARRYANGNLLDDMAILVLKRVAE